MHYQQQPWAADPQQPVNPYPARTAIALTVKHAPLAWIFMVLKPRVILNGQPVPAGWGQNVIDLAPGLYNLHVHVPYFVPPRIGRADLQVMLHPGQIVELEYRAPLVAFLGGSLGGPPQKYRGLGITIAAFALAVVFGVLNGLYAVFGGDHAGRDLTSSPLPTFAPWSAPAPGSDPLSTTEPTLSADPATPTPEADKPTLRPVPARSVTGATFGSADKTYTMVFTGWPFAFRTPSTWGCMGGKSATPDSHGYVCIDEEHPASKQRLEISLRLCDHGCDAARRKSLDQDWFGARTKIHSGKLSGTSYAQGKSASGMYALGTSQFIVGTLNGTTAKWQVGLFATSPSATRSTIQKVVNDIATQASGVPGN